MKSIMKMDRNELSELKKQVLERERQLEADAEVEAVKNEIRKLKYHFVHPHDLGVSEIMKCEYLLFRLGFGLEKVGRMRGNFNMVSDCVNLLVEHYGLDKKTVQKVVNELDDLITQGDMASAKVKQEEDRREERMQKAVKARLANIQRPKLRPVEV